MAWIRKISRLDLLTYGALVGLGILYAVFNVLTGRGGGGLDGSLFGAGWHTTLYYLSDAGRSLEFLLIGAAYFAATLLMFLVIASQARNVFVLVRYYFFNGRGGDKALTKNDTRPTMLGSETLAGAARNAGRTIGRALLVMLPAFIFIIMMSFMLNGLNAFDRSRLVDGFFLGAERTLLGGYAFAIFGAVRYPAFLINFIILCFSDMSGILVVVAFVLAYLNLCLLREFVASFCLAMLLMAPLWFAFPVLSPQDRVVDNVYHLPVTAQIAAAVVAYHPDMQIVDFLSSVRSDKNGLPDLPTSTFPSAHAGWALLAGYYLFRAKKWLGWIALPFLIASTLGTVILAQHYLFDMPVGIIVAAIAIWIVETIIDRGYKDKSFVS